MLESSELLSIKQASVWASRHIGKDVTPSNITYLINYGRILKTEANGATLIPVQELIDYYDNYQREAVYKKKLGKDLNWDLSFDQYKESETTKHVHRLHPYKGKFIPQLVEYFLDSHTDEFKREVFFKKRRHHSRSVLRQRNDFYVSQLKFMEQINTDDLIYWIDKDFLQQIAQERIGRNLNYEEITRLSKMVEFGLWDAVNISIKTAIDEVSQ